MRQYMRLRLAFPTNVEGRLAYIGESDIDEHARRCEFGRMDLCDRGGELIFLAFGEVDAVVDFVVGHLRGFGAALDGRRPNK